MCVPVIWRRRCASSSCAWSVRRCCRRWRCCWARWVCPWCRPAWDTAPAAGGGATSGGARSGGGATAAATETARAAATAPPATAPRSSAPSRSATASRRCGCRPANSARSDCCYLITHKTRKHQYKFNNRGCSLFVEQNYFLHTFNFRRF